MKYEPSDGRFSGQSGYGYKSIAEFVRAAREINAGRREHRSFDAELATIHTTAQTTAILEAGRRSLDAGGKRVQFVYGKGEASLVPVSMKFGNN